MTEIEKLQIVLQTLGDQNRLKIIQFIGEGEKSVGEIVKSVGLSQPLVSFHLKSLRNVNLVVTKRDGPFIYHKLKDLRILDALGVITEIVGNINNIKISRPMFCMPPRWK